MTNVMTTAWEIAYEGVENFGGKVKEYFAEALKMAWELIKGGKVEVKTEDELTYTEVTKEMTKVEQLEVTLNNLLVTDKLSEGNKVTDPEYYEWYVKNKKQSFNAVENVSVAKTIFFEVETDQGVKYYVTDGMKYDDTWFFIEVSEEHFNNIN